MHVDGQVKQAQFEQVADEAPSSAPLGRFYVDTENSGFAPKIKGNNRWNKFLTDEIQYAVKTADYTFSPYDEIVFFNASGGHKVATLPPAGDVPGKIYRIIKTDTDFTKKVTVTPDDPGETINGATTFILKTKNDCIEIMSDGSVWRLISHSYDQSWVAYTPLADWISNVTITGFWRRVGDSVEIDVNVACSGAPTSATLNVYLPAGIQVDTAKITSTAAGYHLFNSQVLISDAGAEKYSGMAAYASVDALQINVDDGDKTISPVTQANPITFANTDAVRIKASGIPVADWAA